MEKEIVPSRSNFFGEIGCWVERTPMHEAASLGHALRLQQLIQSGAPRAQVDIRTVHGSTALCNACAAGSPECAKLLLEYGATANPTLTALTATPLHEACIRGNVDCVQLMIAEGARLEAFDIYFGTPLHAACMKQHVDCARVLLNAGANVNAARFHETALHLAAKENNVDLIEMLVAFGGNVRATDNLSRKPIDYTRPASLSATCLEFYESTPLSLQQLSRVVYRRALGSRAEEWVSKLHLSPRIISYLSYR
ncbi:hypothetical protein SKAU_G00041710 [Synaphobranchus kaupii]|uniref:SOCS box domain-containing protein n=1 Tax=Synaphobranchus kaupii TaxID=118154 RepID=A0A9Q1J7T4_SYNKA|nr:hypothetical protein SKAU_G00041710 [Synaphobranchus kaupii]